MSRRRVAIVGAGVAGTAAAGILADYGIETHLFDRFEIGGHQDGAVTYPGTPVWGLFPGWQVAAAQGEKPVVVDVDAVLLANGSTDQVILFPGNTLPGVMTASGVIRLIRRWRLLPGRRFLIIGDGEVAESVAVMIRDAGGQIVAAVAQGDARPLVAIGSAGVEAVLLDGRTIETDIVVMAGGMQPDLTLAAMAECQMVFDEEHRRWQVWRDDRLRTSVAGIWAAGSVAGSTGSKAAEAEGEFAAASIVHALGAIGDDEFESCQSTFRSMVSSWNDPDAAADNRISQPWRPDARVLARNTHE